MAEAVFVHGGHYIDYTPSTNLAAGTVVVLNDLVGISVNNIVANSLGTIAVSGVFDFVKETGTGTAISLGQKVYWDNTNKRATKNAISGTINNAYLGKCVRAASDTDAIVRVRLDQ